MGRFGSAFVASVLAIAAAGVTATAGFAADLPVPAGPAPAYYPPPPAHYDWTGIYFGGLLGGAFSDDTLTTTAATALQPAGATSTVRPYSVTGGGEVGINVEFAPFVIGAEATWTASNASMTQYTGSLLGSQGFTSAPHSYTTATGKLGYAFNDLLFYAKGGGAWAAGNYRLATLAGGVLTAQQLITDTRSGWTVGAGVEYAFNEWLSAKLEYDYLDFRPKNYVFGNLPTVGGPVPVSVRSSGQLALAGVNFRYNWVKY